MKIVVYTANIGPFDKVLPPSHIQEGVGYVYITDHQPTLEMAEKLGWYGILVNEEVRSRITDDRRLSRYYHIQSCRVFGRFSYDFAIQHDSNMRLGWSPRRIVNTFLLGKEGDQEIALYKHPHRVSVYDEMFTCRDMKKDTMSNMYPQIVRYREEGFPVEDSGLYACMLVVWRHCEVVSDFQRMWWEEVKNGSVREQLSFPYVKWRMPNVNVATIPGDPFTSPIIEYHRR